VVYSGYRAESSTFAGAEFFGDIWGEVGIVGWSDEKENFEERESKLKASK